MGKITKNKVTKSEQQWRDQLSEAQFNVCRKHGTEHAFSGKYADCKQDGTYLCVCCDAPLFSSDSKFDSGTGWPSFWQPVNKTAVKGTEDTKLFMKRIEVHCSKCDSHLGHVFPDGPQPTGLRYCINSVSLKLKNN
ncbi:Peptide-methionine (R)-S-oxide reductase MsrB [hydrothermal vent metagenome]|uniref:peptide-methionine (R)-S-oxide reductase n=1 Tax=hydrothermal vent metagenome TaxID=652676 RepID=A0A3B0ZUA1_9ZZZZ